MNESAPHPHDDAHTDTWFHQYEQAEVDYALGLDHDDALVLNQFANEHPGADLSTLRIEDDVDEA
jgi:hypothetical protein